MRTADEAHLALIEHLRGARGRAALVARLRGAIVAGVVHDGDRVPSSRRLAAELGIARGSVVQAYDELIGEGYFAAVPGGATRVAAAVSARVPQAAVRSAAPTTQQARPQSQVPPRMLMRPGEPSTAGLETDPAWRAAWRRGADVVPHTVPDLRGEPALRSEIARHVRRTRGVDCTAEDVVITAGTAEAFSLVMTTLRRSDRPLRVGVEDPGYRYAARTARAAGARVVPIPVRDGAVDPATLPTLDLLIVTPSHQYPQGGAMTVADRYALLEWARSVGALIVEDDYDSEFRHGTAPLPAITGLMAQPPCVLVGSFSKTLTPSVRLGYFGTPTSEVAAALHAARELLSTPVSVQVQDAMRLFMASGGYRRHLARMRRIYAHRRTLVAATKLPRGLRMSALEGGLHVVLTWARGDAAGTALRARLAAVGAEGVELDAYRHSLEPAMDEGLVLGYAAASDLELDRVLSAIAG